MDISPQLFTLAGVALGAVASYLATALTERARSRRDLASRWEGRRFDTYAGYVSDVKQQGILANRISASLGLHTRVTSPLEPAEGLGLLAEAASQRSLSSERAALLAGEDTLEAIRVLNDAVWLLECYARGAVRDADTRTWEAAFEAYHQALDAFHRSARTELGAPGHFALRLSDKRPSDPLGGRLKVSKPEPGQP